MSKQVVHYKPSQYDYIEENYSACVCPVDHQSPLVLNKGPVRTTVVVRYDKETGEFETMNTIYRPVKQDG